MQKSGLKRVVREATLGDCLSCYWPAGTPAVELHSQEILTDTVCLDQEDGNGQVVLAPSMSIKCPCKNLLSPWTPAGEIRSYRGYTSPLVKNQCFLDFVHIATSKCLSQSRELVHRHFHVKVPSMLANRSQSRAGLTWNLPKPLSSNGLPLAVAIGGNVCSDHADGSSPHFEEVLDVWWAATIN